MLPSLPRNFRLRVSRGSLLASVLASLAIAASMAISMRRPVPLFESQDPSHHWAVAITHGHLSAVHYDFPPSTFSSMGRTDDFESYTTAGYGIMNNPTVVRADVHTLLRLWFGIGTTQTGYADIQTRRPITGYCSYLHISIWPLPILLLIWPIIWAIFYWLRRDRRLPGRCRGCGYDLRASPKRCPECGAAVVA